MFLGHYAVALGAKRIAPRTSLGTLVMAALLLDLLWPLLLLLGLERVRIEPGNTAFTPLNFVHYPISHSSLSVVAWATVFATAYYLKTKYRNGALTLWLLVVSHWFLDAIVHRPDLPLYAGSETFVGIGLWNNVTATLMVEFILILVGVVLYVNSTRAKDKIGRFALWIFLLVLLVIFLANAFGPPPPSVTMLAVTALGQWLFVFWAYWIDRHRRVA